MYLEFYKLNSKPFTLAPDTKFYCNLPNHQAAFNVLLYTLRSGEDFVKITGEVGTGKTILCRKLLNSLQDTHFITAYIPNPDLSPLDLRKTLASELHIEFNKDITSPELLNLIFLKLSKLHAEGKRVVLIVDEAQTLPNESLESLRLLTNLETESEKLLQVVLFGQPELDQKLKRYEFRQLNQRIAHSYTLQPLSYPETEAYINHRLATAGHTTAVLFNEKAKKLIHQFSGGLPRVINILCQKALLAGYGNSQEIIDHQCVMKAVKDSEHIIVYKKPAKKAPWKMIAWITGAAVFIAACLAASYLVHIYYDNIIALFNKFA